MKIRFIGREHTIIKINGNEIKVLENEIIEVEDCKNLINNGFRLIEEENEENILNKINSLQSEINNKKSELENSIIQIENSLLKEVRILEDKYNKFEKQKKQEIFILRGKLEDLNKEL